MSDEAQKELQDDPQDNPQEDSKWTDFGYGCATFLAAVLLLFAPWFFFGDPFPGNIVTLIFSIVLYAGGVVLLLFGIAFFNTGMGKTPELRQLFPSFSGDAWQAAFGAVMFLVIIMAVYLLMRGFELTGIGAVAAKLIIYILAVLAITQMAQAFDGFVIRPLKATAARGPQEFEPLIRRVRQVGILIASVIALIAGIATIIDVFLVEK